MWRIGAACASLVAAKTVVSHTLYPQPVRCEAAPLGRKKAIVIGAGQSSLALSPPSLGRALVGLSASLLWRDLSLYVGALYPCALGIAGVSTAYALGKRGYEVVVYDAAGDSAIECSAAAAGGMQRSNPKVDR
jgi:hypothetical protein